MTPDPSSLVENFTDELTLVMRRDALEKVHAKLSLAKGDMSTPKRTHPRRVRWATSKTLGHQRSESKVARMVRGWDQRIH